MRMLASVVVSLLVLLLGSTSAAQAQNIVLIIADDVGVDTVAAYAESPVVGPTPNIDLLASQGVLFRNAWANPVCSPTRASMLTGLHPVRHGVGYPIGPPPGYPPDVTTGLDPSQQTLPKLLAAGGYRTTALGKWHMMGGPEFDPEHPRLSGFGHYSGFLWGGVNYFNWPKTVDGTTAYTTVYATTDTADDAIAELEGSEPFFLWLAFLAAHGPLHEPPAHLHSYDLAGLDPNSNPALFGKAMIEAMDSEIGRIMAAIDLTDTTVIFVGDNGTPGGRVEPPFDPDHAKFFVYEGGVNVPLIVTGQAVPPASRGQESAALVQATDLFATVLEIAGVPKGKPAHSVSIMGSVIDPSSEGARRTVFAEQFRPNGGPPDPMTHKRAAREARYKLLRMGADTEMYDLLLDPFEQSPLDLFALTPEQATAFALLDATIESASALPVPAISMWLSGVLGLLMIGTGIAALRRHSAIKH